MLYIFKKANLKYILPLIYSSLIHPLFIVAREILRAYIILPPPFFVTNQFNIS